jgi:type II secretory pathway predicted ATPase ExeA
MYLDHFGLREPPFRITPHTEFFFAGANRGATLDALIYAITHDEGIVKVSGEVGSGKTMLCRVLIERLPAHVVTVFLATPSLSRDDILFALAEELRLPVPPSARSAQIVRQLQDHLIQLYAKGHQVVVLIDEAHAMPPETLEEIRLLSNLESNQHKLLQLVMFGQPELNDILARHDMRQLKERITHNFTLGPLGREETADYIDFRLRAAGYKGAHIFSPVAVGLLAGAAQGLTRRINILADKSLLAAYAAGRHEVGPEEAKAAIKDSDFSSTSPRRLNRSAALAAVGIASLAAALTLFLLQPGPQVVVMANPAPAVQDIAVKSAQTTPPNAEGVVLNAAAVPNAAPPPAEIIVDASLGKLTNQRLVAGKAWLSQAPSEHWFIQLRAMDAGQVEQLESFLQRLENLLPPEQTRAYLGKRGNTPRVGVIYGEYENHAAAQRALTSLPAEVLNNQPYLRQVRKLK